MGLAVYVQGCSAVPRAAGEGGAEGLGAGLAAEVRLTMHVSLVLALSNAQTQWISTRSIAHDKDTHYRGDHQGELADFRHIEPEPTAPEPELVEGGEVLPVEAAKLTVPKAVSTFKRGLTIASLVV